MNVTCRPFCRNAIVPESRRSIRFDVDHNFGVLGGSTSQPAVRPEGRGGRASKHPLRSAIRSRCRRMPMMPLVSARSRCTVEVGSQTPLPTAPEGCYARPSRRRSISKSLPADRGSAALHLGSTSKILDYSRRAAPQRRASRRRCIPVPSAVGWVEPRLVAARPTTRARAIGGPHDAEHRSTHPTTDCGSAALGFSCGAAPQRGACPHLGPLSEFSQFSNASSAKPALGTT